MLKVKDSKLETIAWILDGIEKTHFIYLKKSGIRINKHTGIIELGNFKYSPYFNLGKSKYNIPNILLDMCETGLIEKVVEDE